MPIVAWNGNGGRGGGGRGIYGCVKGLLVGVGAGGIGIGPRFNGEGGIGTAKDRGVGAVGGRAKGPGG
jgi:hypothetical protein